MLNVGVWGNARRRAQRAIEIVGQCFDRSTRPGVRALRHKHSADNPFMKNIASVLRTEISRLARKEVRAELEGLKKANAQHRSAIAELRRELAALQKQVKQVDRQRTASARQEAAAERKHRFSAARLAAHRNKLGLSAADYGRLVGMSGATVYLWERGDSRPRAEQVQQLAVLKAMSPTSILKHLAQMKDVEAASA